MNDRLVLLSNNRLLNNDHLIMHHDSNKLLSSDSIYQTDSRYTIDDGMIEDFIISGNEPLNDLVHLESTLNKAPIMTSMMNDDYYNQFSYNHMSTSSNTQYGNHLNTANMNTNTYGSFHPMQAVHNNQNYNHSHVHSHHNNLHNLHPASHHHQNHQQQQQYMHSNSSTPSYITLSSTSSSSTASSQSSTQSASNAALNGSFNTPNSKIASRTAASINSTMCSSSSSSSSPVSNSSFNNINQTLSSTSIEDYDASIEAAVAASLSNVTASPATDPAELARIKQMSGLKLTPDEVQLLMKDRQRKDNHNMIERRRRFNINDRIKELGNLLPKNGEFDAKQNKGSILKASVDYIMHIKAQLDETKKLMDTNKYLLGLNKKLCYRIKELEIICQNHGINYSIEIASNLAAPNNTSIANNQMNNLDVNHLIDQDYLNADLNQINIDDLNSTNQGMVKVDLTTSTVANSVDKRTNDSANKEFNEKQQSKETIANQTGRKAKANKKRSSAEMNSNCNSQQSLNAESSCSENKISKQQQQQQQQFQQSEKADSFEDKNQNVDESAASKIKKQEPTSPKESEIQNTSSSGLQSDTQLTNCALEKPDDSEKERLRSSIIDSSINENSNQSLSNQTQNPSLHQQQQKQQTNQTIQTKVQNPKFIITKINRVNASPNTPVVQTVTNPLVKLVTSQTSSQQQQQQQPSHQAKDQLIHTQTSLTS